MCGITGFIDLQHQTPGELLDNLVTRMADTIRHRGPDDSGIWVDETTGVAFGFRRLAILDLSPTGHQPMLSENGRYVIIFNGEIYNFSELREELEKLGHTFQGHSDTEVMLSSICQWGVNAAVQRFNGMFSFALWDRQEKILHLVRDRLGIKPLYYGWMDHTFLFGSELKAIKHHPSFKGLINRDALALYLRHNYIPSPHTIYQGIYKLPPGTIISISQDKHQAHQPNPYWSARKIVEHGVVEPFIGSDQDVVNELDALLRNSVRQRMIADVPLGAFLSGGVDSSTIVALMQAQSNQPIKTFTIGFWEKEYDEAPYAKAIANHLGTDHTELYVTPKNALDIIPRLPQLYDEPFSDSSQIPTFLISELARRDVTVSLSGDGGDELFAGYDRYEYFWQIWNNRKHIPGWVRDAGINILNWLTPRGQTGSILAAKFQKITNFLLLDSPGIVYHHMLSHWKTPDLVVIGSHEPLTVITDQKSWANLPEFTQQMMYLDLITYLPDDILVKVDRASMGVSLEARVPLLDDHRIVEFAWKLPQNMKMRDGKSKWALRQVLYRYVPPQLIERPKMGFGVPIDYWLRGPLREWAETMLDEQRIRSEGFFNPVPIRHIWTEHIEKKANWQYLIWDILMFQAWLDE